MMSGDLVSGKSYGCFEYNGYSYEVTDDALKSPGAALYIWRGDKTGPFVAGIPVVDTNHPTIKPSDRYLTRPDSWLAGLRDNAVRIFYDAICERSLLGLSAGGGLSV